MGYKGDYVKRDEELERTFEKAQAEDGVTVTQWTNAAYRIGSREGFTDGTIIGSLIGAGGVIVGFGLAALVDFSVRKIRTFVEDRKNRKKATT